MRTHIRASEQVDLCSRLYVSSGFGLFLKYKSFASRMMPPLPPFAESSHHLGAGKRLIATHCIGARRNATGVLLHKWSCFCSTMCFLVFVLVSQWIFILGAGTNISLPLPLPAPTTKSSRKDMCELRELCVGTDYTYMHGFYLVFSKAEHF